MTGGAQRLEFGALDERALAVRVQTRDGVGLATDVYLPPGAGRVPAVLVRLPYDKSGPFSFMPRLAGEFLDRGYAFLVQDVRGKIRSEGETFAFVHEARDGYDTLDWIVAQPWSNGAVGMFGDSYYGFTQWAAAATGHPALRALVPRMTTTRVGPDWMFKQGVFALWSMAEWASGTWIDNALYEVEFDWSTRPLADVVEAAVGRPSASFDRWIAAGPGDPFWTDGLYGGPYPHAAVRVPVLHSGGWWDLFSRGQVADWVDCRRAGAPGQHLIMSATDHFDDPLLPDGEPVRDFLDDAEALEDFVPVYLGPALEFFDRHLLGRGGPRLAPVRWELAGAGLQEADDWPPPAARPLTLYLGDGARAARSPDGGALADRPDSSSVAVEWVHDPADPVPSLVADPWRPLLGLPDEREVELRPDVLTFTAEPSPAPLDLAGPVEATLWVGSSATSMHVVARLVDVYPSGRARRIVEGAALVETSGGETAAVVDLGPTGYRLPAGHRLRLEVASSSFPSFAVHPGTGDDPLRATSVERNTQRLRTGGSSPSLLTLTLLPGG